MERQAPLVAYASLIAYFYAQTDGFVQTDILRYCTMKSVPIFMLALISCCGAPYLKHKLRSRFALGLLFGGIGDFLLSTNELGFLVGAISFAVGHIFYIAYFGTFLKELSYGVSAFSLLYAISVNHFFIIPFLSHLPLLMLTLSLYSFVITAAVVVAGSLFANGSIHEQKGKEFRALIVGYVLFFISDTIILLVQLGFNFAHSHEVVLLTYYAAQYLIFHNAVTAQVIEP
ncbi:60S ribosomal protein L35a [Aphelenchoides fujianensis]|nr:60S ribosomal protein L35a [Aphelenchoides fujianensis]